MEEKVLQPLPNGNSHSHNESSARIQRHQEEKFLPGGWLVQKFGGTAVGKFAAKIAKDVVSAALGENRIAVVCSAMSSSTKGEGTTNRLLRAARQAELPQSYDYHEVVETIRDEHRQAAKSNVKSLLLLEDFINAIDVECDNLLTILKSAQHLEEVSARAEDKIVSKGEKLSCLFMTAVLRDCGVNAVYIDASDVIRPRTPPGTLAGSAMGLDQNFYTSVAASLAEKVLEADSQNHMKPGPPSESHHTIPPPPPPAVPVITGFFGTLPPPGLLASIGRGYTDLCAALAAVGLGATELQVWKEVDGIFTADPRKVPTAVLLPHVTPSEAAELTFYGSEVIHPFTMEQVIRARIPIRIKNVTNPRSPGTLILPDAAASSLEENAPPPLYQPARPKRPTAVTVKGDIAIINVHSNKRTRAHGFLMNIFRILDAWHLSVDLISSSEVHVSMALHSEGPHPCGNGSGSTPASPPSSSEEKESKQSNPPATAAGDPPPSSPSPSLAGAVRDLSAYGAVDVRPHMAIVSLVGRQLRNMVGIGGRFLSVLGEHGVNIEMISQGASEINISCVVDEREADRALCVVHTHLFTFLEAGMGTLAAF